MATVKSFSYSDQNSAVASWVKEQKSLSQSLEIAIKMAIAQYGICDLAEKRDQLFAQGAKIQTSANKPLETFSDAPQLPKQKPVEAKDTEAKEEKPQSMPTDQSHDNPSASTAQTQEPENANNDDSDLDLSFLDLKQ